MKLVITGNPGVGKHTSAKIIAGKIGAEVIDINRVAIDDNAIAKKTERGLEVDVKKLDGLLANLLKTRNDQIVVGHLAPYVLKPAAGISMVAVLRRSPYELEKTLEKRGYRAEKIKENLASEILGVSLYDSLKIFGRRKVVEFDTTGKTPDQTANEIMRALRKKPKPAGIDWLALVSERGDMQRFFEY
ncbi:putative adenylate kinase [Candidatus Nitrososphaera gargensis Ga9.2]|uniref:Putative adenylate kinase n=1 Tax=Nitrososphaera gargensis (strain Ga9.2) TaxID=1237085 RepID=K0IFI4_NITGG|nr:AAA family ATPase [Candidatus Nitrososphaera gargensis]AFU60126.1 putative adenylate kinase [Candidatus Nitrososphaera gargensis Ga9.2]